MRNLMRNLMHKMMHGKILFLLLASMTFLAGYVAGQAGGTTQKTTIHAVAWTPTDGFTDQDFENLRVATAKMAGEMPGMRRAWVGKLRRPLLHGDAERTYGLILEFDDLKTREAYSSHPARAAWAEYWSKARAPRPTVFDVIGE